jgi:hypothetical protein
MRIKNNISLFSILAVAISMSGCDLSDEEKEKLNDAQIDLEQLADQIIITYPANNTIITDSNITVRADIPSAANAQEVTLYVDGVEVSKDIDGAPWELSWPTYYTADGMPHTLLLKTLTGGGNEVRNNQQYQVTVATEANKALAFKDGLNGLQLTDVNSLIVDYSAFLGATKYQVSYSHNGEEIEVDSVTDNVELLELNVGEYVVRYRAIKEYSQLTTLTGPWSEPATIEILPTDLPTIHQPKISRSESGYDVEISWDNLGESDSHTVFFEDSSTPNNISSFEVTNQASVVFSDISAGNHKVWLKRTNSLGHDSLLSDPIEVNVGVFHKRFGGSGDDRAKHVLSTRLGEYLLLASTTSKGDSQGDDWIFKLDEQGEMVWEYLHQNTGSPKFRELQELSNGNVVAFGSSGNWPNQTGLVVLLNPDGTKKWEKEYSKSNFDRLAIKGIAEREGIMYMLSEGRICTTEGSSTSCKVQPPQVESINLENGAINSSVQLSNLNNGLWDGVSSFSSTSSGDFLLSFSVEKSDCLDYWGCSGAGIAIVNTLGEIEEQWNSVGSSSFLNGRYAAESPLGGFVLSGQKEMGDGIPLALFDSNGTYTGTYTFSGAYSNQKEYIAFNDKGLMYQLVEKSYVDWPILISIDTTGNSQERMVLSNLKRDSAYPAALDATLDGGLVLLFTENQDGYNNPDIVIVKIAGLD